MALSKTMLGCNRSRVCLPTRQSRYGLHAHSYTHIYRHVYPYTYTQTTIYMTGIPWWDARGGGHTTMGLVGCMARLLTDMRWPLKVLARFSAFTSTGGKLSPATGLLRTPPCTHIHTYTQDLEAPERDLSGAIL